MATDEEILGAVRGGEVERYGELVERYQLAACKLAYSFVGNFEDARDLAQNAFVQAYRALGRFRGGSRFSTWLYRIVANECKDFFRRKARQPAMVSLRSEADPPEEAPELFELADPRQDPRQAAADRELAGRLADGLGRLPMKQRTAFLLHHLHGMSLEEVSEVMGCRLGTVKAHLFRAAHGLRGLLEPFLSAGGGR